jgi:hypothetical protein
MILAHLPSILVGDLYSSLTHSDRLITAFDSHEDYCLLYTHSCTHIVMSSDRTVEPHSQWGHDQVIAVDLRT